MERISEKTFSSDTKKDEETEICMAKPVRVNARGHVRPRMYNVFPDAFPSKRCKVDRTAVTDDSVVDSTTTMDDDSLEQEKGNLPAQMHEDAREDNSGVLQTPPQPVYEEAFLAAEFDETADEMDNSSVNSNADMKIPIYTGHTMTVFTSVILVWVYALTHSITGSQLSDLLVLLNAHCLREIPVYSSLQSFKKYFADLKSPLVKHYYCSYCLIAVQEHSLLCPNATCKKDLRKKGALSYFIELPLEAQLHDLFKNKSFRENLKHRFNRVKRHAEGTEDIYDGELYKNLASHGNPLSDPNNISLTWNTDGVPVFKSSKVSIWPMFLMINELPYKERIKKSNMLFYGLWFGEEKPAINLFCSPLRTSLLKMEKEGVDINIDTQTFNVKAFLICGTADLPAKATALNMNQFNGEFSCPQCLQKGMNLKTGPRGYVHTFPFKQENPCGPSRVSEMCTSDACEAMNNSTKVNGIKGPTFFMGLKFYDFSASTAIDYMHCVLLGVTKKLITFWFSVSFSSEPFSLIKHLNKIDDRLLKIKPNYNITRRPRTISDHFKYWKASELRSWLFYYSLPVLRDVMSPVYFFHYCSLVQSIWILCQDSIMPNDIDHSYYLLNYFVCMMEPLYGARYMTLNTHSLLHLPRCVKELGPLWAYSCFPFESLNGELLKLFHGTQSVELQIIGAINSHQILPSLLDQLPSSVKENVILKKFIHSSQTALKLKIDHNIYTVGAKKKVKLTNLQKNAFHKKLDFDPVSLTFYDRMKIRNILLHSELYSRVQARNSYTVKYISDENDFCFGHIVLFAVHRFNDCLCEKVCTCRNDIFACIKVLDKQSDSVLDSSHTDYPTYLNLKVDHIHELKFNGRVEVIQLSSIVSLCVDTSYSEEAFFICESPNVSECD